MAESAKQRIAQFKRDLLQELLNRCTEKQQAFFPKVYPAITDCNIESAIDLCERTIKKNEARGYDEAKGK